MYFCIQLDTLYIYFIEKTIEFDRWLRKLKDLKAKAKILFRIQKIESDEHFGDCNPVGNGISELRVNLPAGRQAMQKDIEFTLKKRKEK